MKTLKKSKQKNVILNKDSYIEREIKIMLENKEICFFEENIEESYDFDKTNRETEYRIFLENTKEIKVIYNYEILRRN